MIRKLTAVGVLCVLSAGRQASAQSASVAGTVTNASHAPVFGATIVATQTRSGASATMQSDSSGRYVLTLPSDSGTIDIVATAAGYAVTNVRASRSEDDATRYTADIVLLRTNATVLGGVRVIAQRRSSLRTAPTDAGIGGSDRAMLGVTTQPVPGGAQGDVIATASAVIGVSSVPGADGQPGGFTVLGADPNRNAVALDGLQFNGGSVPRDLPVAAKVSSATYDVSRGGFSGGRVDLAILPGSNITTQRVRLAVSDNTLQAGVGPGAARYQEFRQLGLGLGRSGPLAVDRVYYRVAADIAYRRQQLPDLSTGGAERVGASEIEPATRASLLDAIAMLGVPISGSGAARAVTSGNALGQVDFHPRGERPRRLTATLGWRAVEPSIYSAVAPGGFGGRLADVRTSLQGKAITSREGFLIESDLGAAFGFIRSAPLTTLPEASVLVPTRSGGLATASFGSPSAGIGETRRASVSGRSELTWKHPARHHLTKLTLEATLEREGHVDRDLERGYYGFSSLADVSSNQPSSYHVRLNPASVATSRAVAGAALGATWSPGPRLSVEYGARLDGQAFLGRHNYKASMTTAPSIVSRLPHDVALSPRLGASWRYGHTRAGTPRAALRFGAGRFVGVIPAASVLSSLSESGGTSRDIYCAGAATPPFPSQPGMGSPSSCRDGSSALLMSGAPGITFFSRSYRPTETWRGSINWSGLDWGTYLPEIELAYSRDRALPSFEDLNLAATPVFRSGGDARPVFAPVSAIDSVTGFISFSDSRRVSTAGFVRELRSDLSATAWQGTIGIIRQQLGGTFVRVAYAYLRVNEQARGFDGGTASDPRFIVTGPGRNEVRHAIKSSVIASIPKVGALTVFGELRSGIRYTPLVLGDVNGDGLSNDAAFVFDPRSAAKTELASETERFLVGANYQTRRCVEQQVNRFAARNSCTTPWVASLDAKLQMKPGALGLPSRATLSIEALNVPAGVDRLIHSSSPRGWGQVIVPDPYLYRVVGFSPGSKAFLYRINPDFGGRAFARYGAGSPFQLRVEVSVSLTRDPVKQELRIDRARSVRPSTDTLLARYLVRYPNPFAALVQVGDSIALTRDQVERLKEEESAYLEDMQKLWQRTASLVSHNWSDEAVSAERIRQTDRTAAAIYTGSTARIRSILAGDQLQRLPPSVSFLLDPRFTQMAGLGR